MYHFIDPIIISYKITTVTYLRIHTIPMSTTYNKLFRNVSNNCIPLIQGHGLFRQITLANISDILLGQKNLKSSELLKSHEKYKIIKSRVCKWPLLQVATPCGCSFLVIIFDSHYNCWNPDNVCPFWFYFLRTALNYLKLINLVMQIGTIHRWRYANFLRF